MKAKFQEFLDTATQAAQQAGQILRENWGGKFTIKKKGEIDLVTEIDVQVENLVMRIIKDQFSDHHILAEESGRNDSGSSNSGYLWIIDPLDGTTNFSHGYPCFCVSIALEIDGDLSVGVIYNPLLDELFSAVRGQGAFLNGKSIHVSRTKSLGEALLVTGFAYDVRESKRNNLPQFSDFILEARGVRRDGSAALDFCHLACGRFDGFWEFNLKPWDMAAGALLVQEAGGMITAQDGLDFQLRGPNMVASNGQIHEPMLKILSRY